MLTRNELIASLKFMASIQDRDTLYRKDYYSIRDSQERIVVALPPIKRIDQKKESIRYERYS